MAQLYAAHVPIYKKPGSTDGKAWAAATSAGATLGTKVYTFVPYIVSGPIADGFVILGSLGAVLHVLAWIFALVTDVLTLTESKYDNSGGAVAQLIMTVLSFVFLLGVWVWHLILFCTGKNGIPDGMIPPSILSFITGPVLISTVFSFLYLQGGESPTDSGANWGWFHMGNGTITVPEDNAAAQTMRWYAILGFISKAMIMTFLKNNIRWGGSASD